MVDEATVREAVRWLRYAREDFEAASVMRSEGTPRIACLLAQQSTEKAIKSIYAFLDLPIVKSHDLDMLKRLLPDSWGVKTEFQDLSELSFWAVESRYPGDLPEATEEDADTAIAWAGNVLVEVMRNLREHGFPEIM